MSDGRSLELERRLTLLQRIASAANLSTGIEAALQAVVDLVCAHTGWPVGHVFGADGDSLRSLAVWHLADAEQYAAFRTATHDTPLVLGLGLPGRVLEKKEPVWVEDVVGRDDLPRSTSARACGLWAGFGFPILVDTEVVAVAEFFTSEVTEPDTEVLELMRTVGTQVGRIFERQRSLANTVFDALHDSLTGLPNRTLLLDRLSQLLIRAQRHKEQPFAVVFVDLDRFKVVNDSLGHHTGDELLKTVAVRLRACVREVDTVARLGGDEFALLLDHVRTAAEAVIVVDRVLDAVNVPAQLDGSEVVVTASVGVTLWDESYTSASDMLRDADTAMYQAKSDGKARHAVFTSRMHERAVKLLRVQTDLHRAVERGELELHYQPIVDLAAGSITGFEALLRWRHPKHGLISPLDFIPVAEETGLIVPIGRWVIDEGCRQLARWQLGRTQQLSLSVNVSARQFTGTALSTALVGDVERSVALHGLPRGSLRLEITESVLIDVGIAEETLAALAGLGVGLALDDFGTGYSSLSHVHRFPFDVLKIDRSFVAAMGDGPKNRGIVRAILLLADSLGMHVVAEGIETLAQAVELAGLGCSHAQGYYFSRPLPPDQATLLLDENEGRGRVWTLAPDAAKLP
ncbi:MAG: EAL domain-containing protein [Polyangia bacterium]